MVQISDTQHREILQLLEKAKLPTELIALATGATSGDVQTIRGEMLRRRAEAVRHADENREEITTLLYSEGRPAVIEKWGFTRAALWAVEGRWAEAGWLNRERIHDARLKHAGLYSNRSHLEGTPDNPSREFLMGYYTAVKDLTSLTSKLIEDEGGP